jgi:hypothetical protein
MNCTAAGLNEMQDWQWNLEYVDGKLELPLATRSIERR